MTAKAKTLSPHSQKVLDLLHKQHKPLSAYDILDKLRRCGIKAPPTVYRALDALVQRGLAHRIESLNAYVVCHAHAEPAPHKHVARFAVCRACGAVEELHDGKLGELIAGIGRHLKFTVEREILELIGLCHQCADKGA